MAENRVSFLQRVRSWSAVALTLALFGTVLTLGLPAAPAAAANGGEFNPGNIISDSTFYNTNAMSQAQIQGFLDAKVSSCSTTCLENYRQSTFSRPADAQCGAYNGVANQLASDIIYAVSQACGVNPQVLIVLLEKEQGLVTSTAPTAGKYQSATGYACPDTAPCDAQFYGFYNQVYKAAWQYERYRLNPGTYGYRAGQTNTIKWHPNAACNSSQVYIENQATAGLYIYTPYRPNQAALNNMYGTGDSCSSYGNRNFWRIFTDWFGSTQGGGSFAKTADSADIYLIAGNYRYKVPNSEILSAYWALGPYRTVSAEYLGQFTVGIPLGQVVRDPTTGEIFYSDLGVKHHVSTCEQLAHYATSCGQYIDLTPTQIRMIPSGADLTQFAVSPETGAVYYVSGGTKRWVQTMDDLVRLNGGQVPTFTRLGNTALASIPTGRDYIGTGNVIRQSGTTARYLVDANDTAHAFPSVALAAEFTSAPVLDVSASTIAALAVGPAMTPVVACGSDYYIAGGGSLWRIASNSSSGLPVTALDASTCGLFTKSSQTVAGGLFINSRTSGAVYYVVNGKKSHLSSMAAVAALNGGSTPALVPLSDTVVGSIANGAELLGPTQLVKGPNSATVYMVDGLSRKIPIDSFELASEFGVSGHSVVADSTLAGYASRGSVLTVVVTCGADYYIAAGGALHRINSKSSSGLPVTALDAMTCAALPKSSQSVGGPLFLLSRASGAIYYVANGKKSHLSSMSAVSALNGGTMPTLIPLGNDSLGAIPNGSELLGPTQLVKSASSATVYLVDGLSRKVPIDSFELASDFGINGYSVVSDNALSGYASANAVLTQVVTCGSDFYIASRGSLLRIASNSSSGLPVTALDPMTCAPIAKASTISGPLFLWSPTSGSVYHISNGRKVYQSSMDNVYALNGGTAPILVATRDAALAQIPG